MTVTVERKAPKPGINPAAPVVEGQSPPMRKTVRFTLEGARNGNWVARLSQDTLLLYLPFLSMLIGFWVAFLRPQDALAWLVMAMMMSFVAFGDTNVMTWPRYLRDLAVIFRTSCNSLFSIWLLLFGIYFPEPFPTSSPWTKWLKYKWRSIVPMATQSPAYVVVGVGELETVCLGKVSGMPSQGSGDC